MEELVVRGQAGNAKKLNTLESSQNRKKKT
jgi:hypothetical protein